MPSIMIPVPDELGEDRRCITVSPSCQSRRERDFFTVSSLTFAEDLDSVGIVIQTYCHTQLINK